MGARYFGVLEIALPERNDASDYGWIVGLRHLTARAVDCRAITPTQVPRVLHEWRKPRHEDFRSRTLWSLFNSFTEVYKGQNPATTIRRSQALHGLCDAIVGIN